MKYTEPRVLIIGSEGTVGQRIVDLFPNCVTLDKAGSPDVLADLLEYPDLPRCDVIVMLACATKSPLGPFEAHQPSLHMAEFVVLNAISRGIPVVFASSVWARRHPLNAYGCMKRCVEQMVDSHGGKSIRLGWIGHTPETLATADRFHRGVAWVDERLRKEFAEAVAEVVASGKAAQASEQLRHACHNQIEEWRGLALCIP